MPPIAPPPLYHALIRTHHITSRKKVAHLRKAASKHACSVLLRSGGCPGIMYCAGAEEGVGAWVAAVRNLRYKDFQLVARPALVESERGGTPRQPDELGLSEVESVKAFAEAMDARGVLSWWRRAMGYAE